MGRSSGVCEATRESREGSIRPRYLPPISEDLTVLDLVAPATDEAYECAIKCHLPRLARVPWRLGRRHQAVLSKLRRGYEAMGVDPASVKEHLLSLALEVVHKKMVEMQPVRFGRSWLTDQEGRQKLIRPARYLGHIRPPDSRGRYCLVPWPTAEDVDAFTRWLEQALLREVEAVPTVVEGS